MATLPTPDQRGSIKQQRERLWFDFCDRYGVNDGVLLFDAVGDAVKTIPRGSSCRMVLARSLTMESLVLSEIKKILDDFSTTNDQYEGVIYCMFHRINGRPHPLYIGKSEKFGKSGGNLSANIKNIKAGTLHPFARWGYNYAYHMGDLSAAVLRDDHPENKRQRKYEAWADALFEKPHSERGLKQPVYFWMKAWKRGSTGPWADFGPTNLTFLEYLLIGIASAVFPDLLNAEGTNRG